MPSLTVKFGLICGTFGPKCVLFDLALKLVFWTFLGDGVSSEIYLRGFAYILATFVS